MYLPSNSRGYSDDAGRASRAAASDARIADARRMAVDGRLRAFRTIVSPNQLTQVLGAGAGLNAAILQQQTQTARATGLLGVGLPDSGPVIDTSGAPEVVPMRTMSACRGDFSTGQSSQPLAVPPVPLAPSIVDTAAGPMYFNNNLLPAPAPSGNWIADNPWWALAIAGAGVLVLNKAGKRR